MSWFGTYILTIAFQLFVSVKFLHGQEMVKVKNGLKPVPNFTLDTIKQAENIVLYDNVPLNTGNIFT